ncbi:hypothetical protein IE81DRAFT_287254 [Ceraceosorus guamensis]|uniref:PLC-like phosphodiesterase n=1 Tax=Ceraceosorus guamensis TaxID=1522189 RepID=A0A316W5M0_9BASI|nr:hypothetical protein IE81DRAFT_287254 [Ceraceosorus guamensis]PWN44368.1 hypothetical protein IE81DRAFT_287254 [Ceraceosorus guamensis]
MPFYRRATNCNGDLSLCERSYGNVTFVGAHNSYGIHAGSTNVAANQNISITDQLDAGVRLLQSQAHRSSNVSVQGAGIDLCHSDCSLFQGGTLEYWLSQIVAWSNANPNNVVTLLIVNSDNLPASQFAQAFESTGAAAKSYNPSSAGVGSNGVVSRSQWPSLGTMIDARTPLVSFLSTQADDNNPGYLLPEFSNVWETPFDQTSVPFNCSVDRMAQGSDSSNLLALSNNFRSTRLFGDVTYPDTGNLGSTNSEQTQLDSAYTCAAQHGNANPNFILTDYSQTGDYGALRAAAQLNGVSYTPPRSSSGSSASGNGSSSSGNAASCLLQSSSLALLAVAVGGMALFA